MIKANTCPYCGAPYTINDGGCRAKCAHSQLAARLINAAIEEQEAEDDERARQGLPHRER